MMSGEEHRTWLVDADGGRRCYDIAPCWKSYPGADSVAIHAFRKTKQTIKTLVLPKNGEELSVLSSHCHSNAIWLYFENILCLEIVLITVNNNILCLTDKRNAIDFSMSSNCFYLQTIYCYYSFADAKFQNKRHANSAQMNNRCLLYSRFVLSIVHCAYDDAAGPALNTHQTGLVGQMHKYSGHSSPSHQLAPDNSIEHTKSILYWK